MPAICPATQTLSHRPTIFSANSAAPLIKPSTFLFTFKTPSRLCFLLSLSLFSRFFSLVLSPRSSLLLYLSSRSASFARRLLPLFLCSCPLRSTTQIELILVRSSCCQKLTHNFVYRKLVYVLSLLVIHQRYRSAFAFFPYFALIKEPETCLLYRRFKKLCVLCNRCIEHPFEVQESAGKNVVLFHETIIEWRWRNGGTSSTQISRHSRRNCWKKNIKASALQTNNKSWQRFLLIFQRICWKKALAVNPNYSSRRASLAEAAVCEKERKESWNEFRRQKEKRERGRGSSLSAWRALQHT